jgi:hypothetical protein
MFEELPIVGGLLRRARRDVSGALSYLRDESRRSPLDIDAIMARIDIDTIMARIDLDAIVAHIDVDAIVARLDVDDIVSRLDVDEIVSRLDLNDVVARLDFPKLVSHIVEGIDLPNAIKQAGNSVVRRRRPTAGGPA